MAGGRWEAEGHLAQSLLGYVFSPSVSEILNRATVHHPGTYSSSARPEPGTVTLAAMLLAISPASWPST